MTEKKAYIERGAALLAITGQPSELHYPDWYKGNIMEVPAADVAPVVHGEWIYHECVSTFDGIVSGYSCSICSIFVDEETYDSDRFCNDFCGHCGAKMDGRTYTLAEVKAELGVEEDNAI